MPLDGAVKEGLYDIRFSVYCNGHGYPADTKTEYFRDKEPSGNLDSGLMFIDPDSPREIVRGFATKYPAADTTG